MRVFWIISIIVAASADIVLALFFPNILGENKFLKVFVSHELLAFLIVILIITFASVANINLAVSRTQTSIQDSESRKNIEEQFAKPLRNETQSSAWLLFWSIIICVASLITKGFWDEDIGVTSLVHGIALIILVINAVVIHDIYSTIFELIGISEPADDKAADHTAEGPSAG